MTLHTSPQANEPVLVQTPICTVCDLSALIEVPLVGLERYLAGSKVQDAFPDLDAGIRELILTGTHPECWDTIFADDDGRMTQSLPDLQQKPEPSILPPRPVKDSLQS